MSKVIILGNGFVASHLKYDKVVDRVKPSESSVEHLLDVYKPDVIINCIGRCGNPNVDYCESHKEETLTANVIVPTVLATVAAKHDIRVIHVSSGCIFYGSSPNIQNDIDLGWKEDDFANPKSYYSKTKYSCDLSIGYLDNVVSLRIRMPVSSIKSPRNLINKLIKYTSVLDVKNSMTFMPDLINVIDYFVENNKNGIWHVTNPNPLSPADVIREYQKYNIDHKFNSINEEELSKLTIATRSNCFLNTEKLNSTGISLMPSEEALKIVMKEYIKNI